MDIGRLVVAGDAKTEQKVLTARADVWLLPFLNLYGILGYMDGNAEIWLGPAGLPIYELDLNYEGPVLGAGCTVAGGFKLFDDRATTIFGQVDLNYTRTFLSFDRLGLSMDGGIDALVCSGRLGVRDRVATSSSLGDVYLSLWGGAMFQRVQSVLPGRIELINLAVKIEQEACNAWNPIFGSRLEIGKNFDLMVEVGVGDRQSLLLGAAFRF